MKYRYGKSWVALSLKNHRIAVPRFATSFALHVNVTVPGHSRLPGDDVDGEAVRLNCESITHTQTTDRHTLT